MAHREGECPVCKKPFAAGDDIVICPICGAPYHRECYMRAGQCVFTELHRSGFEYKPPGAAERPAESPAADEEHTGGVLCKSCSTVNDARNIFCERCGAALHSSYKPGGDGGAYGSSPYSDSPYGGGSPFGGGQAGGVPFGGGLFGGQSTTPPPLDLAGELDGIPKRDWATFIGNAAATYLPRLSAQVEKNTKVGVLFSAFFFSSFYFAYRKMWVWAALSLVLFLFLKVPNALQVLGNADVFIIPGLSLSVIGTLTTVFFYIDIVRRLAFGSFALWLFRKDAARKMNTLRDSSESDAAYQAALHRRGAPSIPAVVVVSAIIIIAFCAIYWVGGDALYSYLMSSSAAFSA